MINGNYILQKGKYRGYRLHQVPVSYLKYLVEIKKELNDEEKELAEYTKKKYYAE